MKFNLFTIFLSIHLTLFSTMAFANEPQPENEQIENSQEGTQENTKKNTTESNIYQFSYKSDDGAIFNGEKVSSPLFSLFGVGLSLISVLLVTTAVILFTIMIVFGVGLILIPIFLLALGIVAFAFMPVLLPFVILLAAAYGFFKFLRRNSEMPKTNKKTV